MKTSKFWINRSLVAAIALFIALPVSAETWVRYQARPGSKVSIDGTSTIHDWTVEGQIIGGFMELESNFSLESGKAPQAGGKVNAKVEVEVPVRSLKSGKKLMDDVMYGAMKQEEFPKIQYRLKELAVLPPSQGAPLKFDSTGDLTVSGVTKSIKMQVTMEPMAPDRVKVTGQVPMKMTEFGIKPPAPSIGLGLIKTGDDVKITFTWLAARQKETAKAQ